MFTAHRCRMLSVIVICAFVVLCGVRLHVSDFIVCQEAAAASGLTWQEPAKPGAARAADRPAGQVFKNVQVLTDIPASQLGSAMNFMAASLGVGCDFCHSGAWDSDEKSTKVTTRRMLLMTADINKKSFSGFSVVNCYTCHRGRTEPISVPEIEDLAPRAQPYPGNSSGVLPSAEEVVSRYQSATGGSATLEKVTTCIFIGTQTTYGPAQSPENVPIEIYNKKPGKVLLEAKLPAETVTRGFDGMRGWTVGGNRVERLEGEDLSELERDADLYQYLNLRSGFSGFRILAREKIRDRDVIVAGSVARDGALTKLYFDAGSGLLVRRAGQTKTPLGTLPDVIEFEDYRRVNGVIVPFVVKRSRPPATIIQRFSEVKVNVPIDDDRFSPPVRPGR